MATFRLVTLGCKVNQYETQHVREALARSGHVEAAAGEPAELCVVNTCTVTHEGDAKSRQAIRRLHQHSPNARLVVMGCYASRAPDEVRRLPGVEAVLTDKARLAEGLAPFGVTDWPAGISRFDGHQRAFVKVQDGCLLDCAYCIIPSVRPNLRSRSIEEITEEVARLVESGYQEVVLTGVHLGHYGLDLSKGRPRDGRRRLWHLLDALAAQPGDFRIRLSSLEAAEARDDLIAAMARHPRVCPHLHLCLQSGSDRVLKAMRRRYTAGGLLARVARIRQALDEPALTTDVIVGFPGESEADFAQTCRVVREAGFSRLHVFSYSPRAGTPAARQRDDVPPAVKAARRRRLVELGRELAEAYDRRLIGRTLDVLVEGGEAPPGMVRGTSCRYAPVVFGGLREALLGRRVPVRALAARDGALWGEPAPAGPWSPGRRLSLPLLGT